MKFKTRNLLPWLVAATFAALSGTTLAVPKAAEQEDAPVTMGADVAKPKLSAKAAKPAKAREAKKSKVQTKAKATRNARAAKKPARTK